uniref:Uncharacterized protein n=1 Tax=Octopus bimaculoides TaxID=37653 RepID=A0A0L8I2K5_OCTBM
MYIKSMTFPSVAETITSISMETIYLKQKSNSRKLNLNKLTGKYSFNSIHSYCFR